MLNAIPLWTLIATGCGPSEVADSAVPELCREEVSEYDEATAPIIKDYGYSYLVELLEWNSVEWSTTLDGSETSTFSRVFSYREDLETSVVEWVPAWTDDAIWPCREERATRFYLNADVAVDSTALQARLSGTLDLFADQNHEFRWSEFELDLSDEWQALLDQALLDLDPAGSAELSLVVGYRDFLLAGQSGDTVQPFWEGRLVPSGGYWAGPPPP